MYAVNVVDLLKFKDDIGVIFMVKPVLSEQLIQCEPDRMDSQSMVMTCDDDRAKAIIELIRRKFKRHELRIYNSATGKGWKRI